MEGILSEKELGVRVPNQFPTSTGLAPYRIAIIGEAPGLEETEWRTCMRGHGYPHTYYDSQCRKYITNKFCPECGNPNSEKTPKPFVGASGRFLTSLLIDAAIQRGLCYIGNVCQYRPPNNDISAFNWESYQIQQGLVQLKEDIDRFKPNLVILFGNTPLRAAMGTYTDVKGKQKLYSISNYRGSVFMCDRPESPFYGIKCLATYHPASLFHVYGNTALVRIDLNRARKHGSFAHIPDTGLVLDSGPNFETIIARLKLIKERKIPVSVDIEGYVGAMSCISISPAPKQSFIIPFTRSDGLSFWTLDEEVEIWTHLSSVLEDPEIPKILQNAMYDRFVLAYSYKTLIRNVRDDTMVKHWEQFCEFEKALAIQTSIYTEHAYYKNEGESLNQDTFWKYCCKDSAITYEISDKLDKLLENSPKGRAHYNFNMQLQDPFLFAELKGMRLALDKRRIRTDWLNGQAYFDSKRGVSAGTEQKLLEELVGWQINVNSNPHMQTLLYDQLKFPVKLKKRKGGDSTPTADYETLLKLGFKTKNKIIMQCIKVRQIRKRCSDIIGMTPDPDGRIRSSINIVGAVTGRTSSSEAPTGEGRNLQNITDDDRDLILADEDHDFGQCDLKGADGWTVAAHCARLGDPTMLDDYLYGLKPAQIIALMYLHGAEVNNYPRDKIKEMSKAITAETDKTNNYLYFTCKRAQHGTNYQMGAEKLCLQMYLDTEGMVDVPVYMAEKIQALYLLRYKGVKLWQQWCGHELKTKGYLINASGQKRIFFGRKDNPETLRDFIANEPQHNTTYATNLALLSLWIDPDNHNSDGSLKVWPCHHVHDALITQWHQRHRDFAREKMPQWFNNPIMIAGIKITIPYDGKFGPSWGELSEKNKV